MSGSTIHLSLPFFFVCLVLVFSHIDWSLGMKNYTENLKLWVMLSTSPQKCIFLLAGSSERGRSPYNQGLS